MYKTTSSNVRYLFVGFLGALAFYAGAESLVAGGTTLYECGSTAVPCQLETLTVTARRESPAHAVSAPAATQAVKVTLAES